MRGKVKFLFFIIFLSVAFDSFTQTPKLMLPIGHTWHTNDAIFSKDNQKVITVGGDGTIKVWETYSGKLVLNLNHPLVFKITLCNEEKKLISTGLDGTIKIWNLQNGEVIFTIKAHSSQINDVKISPDNKYIATASDDKTIKIWELISGKAVSTLSAHSQAVWTLCFSSDGKKLLSSAYDKKWIEWDFLKAQVLFEKTTLGIYAAKYSPNNSKIITTSYTQLIVWNAVSKDSLFAMSEHQNWITALDISSDNSKILSASLDGTIKLWNANDGKLIKSIKSATDKYNIAKFSIDSKYFLITNGNNVVVYTAETAKPKVMWSDFIYNVHYANFSANGNFVIIPNGRAIVIMDCFLNKEVVKLKGHTQMNVKSFFIDNDRKCLVVSHDYSVKIWDVQKGTLLKVIKGHSSFANDAVLSKNEKLLITVHDDGTAVFWDLENFKVTNKVTFSELRAYKTLLNLEENLLIVASFDGYVRALDIKSNKFKYVIKCESDTVSSISISPNGKQLLVTSYDKLVTVRNIQNGEIVHNLLAHKSKVEMGGFSNDGNRMITLSSIGEVMVWNAQNGALLHQLIGHKESVENFAVSSNNKFLATASFDNTCKVWNLETGKLIFDLKGHFGAIKSVFFSKNDSFLFTSSMDFTLKKWDLTSGKMVKDMTGHSASAWRTTISKDGKFIVSNSYDNTSKLWETESGKLLYTFFVVDTTEYLVLDANNRFDGTEKARKLLYFTCGTEIIELDQIKDQLWVPNLAERIMSNQSIQAKTLTEMDVCGFTPEVQRIDSKTENYHFSILPKKGGIGETILSVNGNPTKTFLPQQLHKNGANYELIIPKTELQDYFVVGENNSVSVKSFAQNNTISSRGFNMLEDNFKKEKVEPNLYAVIIGVGDYKGEELDLNFATKDANDISKVISSTAKKFLNFNDKEHVFIYTMTTEKGKEYFPEKKNIQIVLEEIGKKATANDIILLFFAGHGVFSAVNKQFYFLTADASLSTSISTVQDVGISSSELIEWLKPQNIKAQKRILIFDACNSGQAINDFVSKDFTVRNDEKAQQIKAIDKLNEKSGLFILSASASNQSAYEMSTYSQGILTYSLLKAIKQNPEILNFDKFLDVSKWFNVAKESVIELSKENGIVQEPQVVSNTNFNIGIVDFEVQKSIVLPKERIVFGSSNFQNSDEFIADDNLELSKLLNLRLKKHSQNGTESKILFNADANNAYTLSGRYTVKGKTITVKVNLKQNKMLLSKFEITGEMDKLSELVNSVILSAEKQIEIK